MWLVWVPLVAAWFVLPYLALVRRRAWLHTPAFARETRVCRLRGAAAGVAVVCLLLTPGAGRAWTRTGAWR